MGKKLILPIILLATCCTPCFSRDNGVAYSSDEVYDAEACNHNTGECYNAEVDLKQNIITISLNDSQSLVLELEYDKYDEVTAYDDKNQLYYDIEIFK